MSKIKTQQYRDGLIEIKPYQSSKAELEILATLKAQGVNVIHQYQIPGVAFFYDFYLPDQNLIIEYNGDYWHANPKKYLPGTTLNIQGKGPIAVESIWERDALKKQLAEEAGYQLDYIWESDYEALGIFCLHIQESIRRLICSEF